RRSSRSSRGTTAGSSATNRRCSSRWTSWATRRRSLACRRTVGELDEKISEAVEQARESRLNSIIALLVAVAATLMALDNIKDGNIGQAMAQAQAHTVDAWSYYQAKSTKQNLAQ